ncbi:MAG: oligosaccharide flippase family protein [Clostridia bacterium]|nr:oligosaccharide flippase family protein [Clostridia bacterium]
MKKKLEIRLPAKAGAWYVVSSFLIKLGGMAATPIFTHAMSAEEYGKYALYMSWIAILSVITTLGLTGSVVYRGMQKFEDRRDELISSALGLSLVMLGAFASAFLIWGKEISSFTGLDGGLSVLLIGQIALDTVVAFYTAKSRYVYGYGRVIAINLISAFLSLGISLLLVFLVEPTANVRIYALLFSTLIFALPLFITILWKGKRLFSRDIWGFLLKFNLPLLPHSVSAAVLANVDKVMISGAAGGAALAKYSVAHSLGVGMTFVTGGLGSALQPWIMRKIAAGKEARVASVSLKITLLISIGALGILTLAPELLSLLAPDSYSDALISVYPITLAAIVGFVATVASVGILHEEKTGLLSLSAIVGALVNIGANFLLLPYSYNGAAFAFLGASIASAAISIIAARKVMRSSIVRALPSIFVFLISAALSFILYAMRALFVPRMIALVILAALGVLALLNIKKDITERKAAD